MPGAARRDRDRVREHRARSCSTRTSRSSPSSAGWASSRSSTERGSRLRRRPARGRLGWRLWARRPGAAPRARRSGRSSTSGSSLVDLVGTNPPPADEFDIRRVEFSPGEIRIIVRNPQPDDLTIANVNVDDAIVPFTVDGPTTLGRLRSSTIVVPYDWVEDDPITVGVTSSTGIETVKEIPAAVETPEPSRRGLPRLRAHRLPRRRAPDRARAALAPGAPAGRRRCGSRRSWRSPPGCSRSSASRRSSEAFELQAALARRRSAARGSCSSASRSASSG